MLSFAKPAILLYLAATAVASPTFELVARAKVPDFLDCDNTPWTGDQIRASLRQSKALGNGGFAYPKGFGNKDAKGNPIFAAQGNLWEFPLTDPVWYNNNVPGTYRVIMKDDYSYVGVTNKDGGTGGTVHKC
ncbi:hypothetical protein GGS20DRAFT_233354 [Poronia punctata]|nr:hypothetical protein GGS20DRAFT_233354 [Poronia punctata]